MSPREFVAVTLMGSVATLLLILGVKKVAHYLTCWGCPLCDPGIRMDIYE